MDSLLRITVGAGAALLASTIFIQRAEAYLSAPSIESEVSDPVLTRIDNRDYRHCHNKGVHVVCYTSLSGASEPKGSHERRTDRRAATKGHGLIEHHHMRPDGRPCRH